MSVNTKYFKGDINTSSIFLDPPDELVGQINVVRDDGCYVNGNMVSWWRVCSDDKAMLKKVNDTLLAAKPKWKSMDYGNLAKFVLKTFMLV